MSDISYREGENSADIEGRLSEPHKVKHKNSTKHIRLKRWECVTRHDFYKR